MSLANSSAFSGGLGLGGNADASGVCSRAAVATLGEELLAAEHPLAAPRGARRRRARSMRVCVGSPGTFSTRKCRSAHARDLRQVRDRQDLRAAPRGAASVSPTACAVLAADARVDLVEDHRLAARDGGDRERDARQLAARGRLRGRRERQAGVRPDEERAPRPRRSGRARARRARAANSPSPRPTLSSSPATACANGAGRLAGAPRRARRRGRGTFASAAASRLGRGGDGIDAAVERVELRRARSAARASSSSKVAQRKRRFASGDPVELGLDLLEPLGLGLERRRGSARSSSAGLAQAHARRRAARRRSRGSSGASCSSGASARSARADEARRRRRPRRARARRPPLPTPSASSVDVPQPLALARAASSSAPGSSPSVSSTSARSSATPRLGRAAASRGELLVPAPRRAELAPRASQLGATPQLLLADERVEHVELVARRARAAAARTGPTSRSAARRARPRPRGPRSAPTRTRACGRRRRSAARARARPRPRAAARRAPRSPPRRAGRRGARAPPRRTPRTRPARPRRRRPSRRAAARPPGRRIVLPAPVSPVIAFRPVRELELGLADQDEVLDPEPTKQRCRGSGVKNVASGTRGEPAAPVPRRTVTWLARSRGSPISWPSTSTVSGTSVVLFSTTTSEAARHDERARVERVRRDERHRHRVEPPDEHRAAVREVVRGRARGRGDDHAVARQRPEVLAADGPAQLDHAAEHRARRDDVVHDGVRLAVELDLERRQLDDLELAGEGAREPRLELGSRRSRSGSPRGRS